MPSLPIEIMSGSIHHYFSSQTLFQACSGTATIFFQPHPLGLPFSRITASSKAIAFYFRNFLSSHEEIFQPTGVHKIVSKRSNCFKSGQDNLSVRQQVFSYQKNVGS